MQYLFIINPVSGAKKNTGRLIKQIEQKFSVRSGVSYRIAFTEYAGHGRALSVQAAENKTDIVVSVGGDGTMNEIAGGLVNSGSVLGLIPMGSGNGFARSLGIPIKITEALDVLLNASVKTVDCGKINGNYFFGLTGVGLDAEIGARFQEFGVRGPLPYFYIGTKEYLRYDYEEFKIISGDKKIQITPLLITVANTSQYGNGAIIAPQADPCDGLFDVCTLNKMNFFRTVKHVSKLFSGEIERLPAYSTFKTDFVKIIRSKESGFFHIDGEPKVGGKILEIEMVKNALKVCVRPQL